MKKKVLIVSKGCNSCENAKEELSQEIKNGDIEIVDIDDLEDEILINIANCLIEKEDRIGVPILSEIEEDKVCSCQLGV